MSAKVWHRRRENKRFQIAIKNGISQIKTNPDLTIYLEEWQLVMISPERYDWLTIDVERKINELSWQAVHGSEGRPEEVQARRG